MSLTYVLYFENIIYYKESMVKEGIYMNVLKKNLKCFIIIFILAAVVIMTAILETVPGIENFLQSIQGIISPERLSAVLLVMLVSMSVISIIIAKKIK